MKTRFSQCWHHNCMVVGSVVVTRKPLLQERNDLSPLVLETEKNSRWKVRWVLSTRNHPSLWYTWECNEYYAFAIPKHGHHHFLSVGNNPKFFRWRWVGVLPLSWLLFAFFSSIIANDEAWIVHYHNAQRTQCLIHSDNWWKESMKYVWRNL